MINAATTAPTGDSNGVLVPRSYRHVTTHLITSKENVADIDVYGQLVYCNTMNSATTANIWIKLDSVSFSGTVSEAQRLRDVAGFHRICAVRTDANVSNRGCNILFGFSEAIGVS